MRDRKYFAGGHCLALAIRTPQNETAGLIKTLEYAGQIALSRRDANFPAEPKGAREPFGSNDMKTSAVLPLRQPVHHPVGEPGEQVLRRRLSTAGLQMGRRIARVLRVMRAIHADPNDDEGPLPFDQNSGDLRSFIEEVVRPLQHQRSTEANKFADGIMHRQGRHERQLRRALRRRRFVEQKTGIEISWFRDPSAAAPTASRGL